MDLEDRLVALGDLLDVDTRHDTGSTLSERVLDQLDNERTAGTRRTGASDSGVRWLRYAAVVALVAAVAALAVPSSRHTIAGWFGLDGVRILRGNTEVSTASTQPDATGSVELPGPGDSREVVVDGQVVLVSVIEGSLADDVLVKTLGPDTEIVEVDVDGAPGLWISGEPHELAYRSASGIIEFERVAGNTLVWQDGQRIDRLEGFDSMEAAIEYALTLGTDG